MASRRPNRAGRAVLFFSLTGVACSTTMATTGSAPGGDGGADACVSGAKLVTPV